MSRLAHAAGRSLGAELPNTADGRTLSTLQTSAPVDDTLAVAGMINERVKLRRNARIPRRFEAMTDFAELHGRF